MKYSNQQLNEVLLAATPDQLAELRAMVLRNQKPQTINQSNHNIASCARIGLQLHGAIRDGSQPCENTILRPQMKVR